MQYVNRGRGAHRWIHLCAAATLGIALSGCGGSSGSAASAASTGQAPTVAQSPAPAATSTDSASAASTSTSGIPAGESAGSQPTAAAPPVASAGVVTLNWLPPTENVDGTPLTDLAGYDIHYGTASGDYTKKIAVSNPGIATYVVSDLTPGTYYFSVAAVNADGTESPLSSEVRATVD